jgi:hypothetical protein
VLSTAGCPLPASRLSGPALTTHRSRPALYQRGAPGACCDLGRPPPGATAPPHGPREGRATNRDPALKTRTLNVLLAAGLLALAGGTLAAEAVNPNALEPAINGAVSSDGLYPSEAMKRRALGG